MDAFMLGTVTSIIGGGAAGIALVHPRRPVALGVLFLATVVNVILMHDILVSRFPADEVLVREVLTVIWPFVVVGAAYALLH